MYYLVKDTKGRQLMTWQRVGGKEMLVPVKVRHKPEQPGKRFTIIGLAGMGESEVEVINNKEVKCL